MASDNAKIHSKHPIVQLLMVWSPAKLNPSDLNSKSHSNLLQVLNGDMWRKGPPEFTLPAFPSSEIGCVVYAHFENGCYHWHGFPQTAQHMINCVQCMNVETGRMVAVELTHHSAVLSPGSDAGKQTETDSEHGQPVLTQHSDPHPAGSDATGVDSLPPAGANQRLLVRFSDIDSYTCALASLIMKAKKSRSDVRIMMKLRLWFNVCRESQKMFPPTMSSS